MFRRILTCLILLLTSFVFAGERDPLQEEIRRLIRHLGDESFVVRERAEAQLLRIGIDAYPELQKARSDTDAEIVRRSEKILSQLSQLLIDQEHKAVYYWIISYAFAVDRTKKARIIWLLCDPLRGPRHGEGLRTLCRIAKFDDDRSLRAEAVKGLIASPPLSADQQRKWYRSIRETIADPGEDDLLLLLSCYAKLRCDLEDLKEATEKQAREEEKRTGVDAVYPTSQPVSLPVDDTIRRRIGELTDRMAEFQSKPENSAVRSGNWNDILLFYALAEIQSLAGLAEEMERTVAAALTVRSEDIKYESPIDPDEHRAFFEHYYVARILHCRYRIAWDIQHAKLVLEHGHILLKIRMYPILAVSCQFRRELAEAAEYYDQAIDLVSSKDYTNIRNDSAAQTKDFRSSWALCLGQMVADVGDWKKAREFAGRGLKDNPNELDILILAWQSARKDPEANDKERQEIDRKINDAIRNTEQKMHDEMSNKSPQHRVADPCNQVAWILANTEGDYASALQLIETALKSEPENVAYLDTLAHVYNLGKQYDKAVETQARVVCLAPEVLIFHDALERFRKERNANR